MIFVIVTIWIGIVSVSHANIRGISFLQGADNIGTASVKNRSKSYEFYKREPTEKEGCPLTDYDLRHELEHWSLRGDRGRRVFSKQLYWLWLGRLY